MGQKHRMGGHFMGQKQRLRASSTGWRAVWGRSISGGAFYGAQAQAGGQCEAEAQAGRHYGAGGQVDLAAPGVGAAPPSATGGLHSSAQPCWHFAHSGFSFLHLYGFPIAKSSWPCSHLPAPWGHPGQVLPGAIPLAWRSPPFRYPSPLPLAAVGREKGSVGIWDPGIPGQGGGNQEPLMFKCLPIPQGAGDPGIRVAPPQPLPSNPAGCALNVACPEPPDGDTRGRGGGQRIEPKCPGSPAPWGLHPLGMEPGHLGGDGDPGGQGALSPEREPRHPGGPGAGAGVGVGVMTARDTPKGPRCPGLLPVVWGIQASHTHWEGGEGREGGRDLSIQAGLVYRG